MKQICDMLMFPVILTNDQGWNFWSHKQISFVSNFLEGLLTELKKMWKG